MGYTGNNGNTEGIRMDTEALENSPQQPTWNSLPTLVLSKLFGMLNYKNKKSSRQVCSNWKYGVDQLSGLSLVIDEFRDEIDFLEFLQTVKICQASIGNVIPMQQDIQWKYPGSLRKVTCHGRVEQDWFCNHILEPCQNLTKLILKGDFLSRLIINNKTAQQPIICPNLKALEIISPRGNIFPRHFAMSYYLNAFSDPTVNQRNNAETIQHSMHYILKTIRSPQLSLVNIYVYENFLISKSDDYWKHTPFEEFLEAHRQSLKEVYLHEFRGKRSNDPSPRRSLPSHLSHMQVSIHRFHHVEGNPKTEQNQDFLMLLLVNQIQLEELSMELHKMRTVWFLNVLTKVINNCKNTLSVLKIQIVRSDEDDCILSGVVLSELVCLEELKLEGDALTNNVLTLSDFSWLPKTLKKILTMFIKIEEKKFNCIHEFKDLKYVELNHIVLSGDHQEDNHENINNLENFEESHLNPSAVFTTLLQQLICHRGIDHLGVSLNKCVSSCETLKNLIETISTTPRPRKKSKHMPNYFGLVIAHQYEMDDKFDLYKSTNRESFFSDDAVFQLYPRKDTDTVSLVEVRVEVDRRESSEFYEQELADGNINESDFSDTSSGMPSLSLITSDVEEDMEDVFFINQEVDETNATDEAQQ